MKSAKKRLISTCLSIASLSALIGLAVSSYSWFYINKTTKGDGMDVQIISDKNISIENFSYEIYGYELESDEPTIISDSMELGEYNIFMPFRNTYNRRIIRLNLVYPNGVDIVKKISVTVNCLKDLLDKDGHVDTQISNLIQFKFFDNYEGKIHIVDEEHSIRDVYKECVAVFDSMPDSSIYTFVDVNASSKTENDKTKEFEAVLPMPQTASGKNYKTDFFIEYNYNDKLVNYFKNNSDISFDLDFFKEGQAIPFDMDIEKIKFGIKG